MTNSNSKLTDCFHEICDTQSCTGCLACYNACKNNAIVIKNDAEGFPYPFVQEERCVGCKLCEKVCPILGNLQKNPISDIAYAAWSKNKKIINNSSSGGLYSVIAKYILKQGGVVFGAAFDKDWNVCHVASCDEAGFNKTRGSKYVQSYIGTTYRDAENILRRGSLVLFSGTPCQIAGLKAYLTLNNCNTDNLYMIDLVCHGVPSPLVFKSYLEFLERRVGEHILDYSFRDKRWSWERYNSKVKLTHGRTHFGKWEDDPYLRGFLREYYLRLSCHQCIFATEQRCGDFTLSDYWGYTQLQDEVYNHDKGVSLVIPNSAKAKYLFQQILPAIVFYEREINDAMKGNQAFHQCFAKSPQREEFWKDFRDRGFDGIIDKYLYPEEIQPQYKEIYKYTRKEKNVIEILHRLRPHPRRMLRKIKKLFASK